MCFCKYLRRLSEKESKYNLRLEINNKEDQVITGHGEYLHRDLNPFVVCLV